MYAIVGCASAASPARYAELDASTLGSSSPASAAAFLPESRLATETSLSPVETARPMLVSTEDTRPGDREATEAEAAWLSPSRVGAAVRAHHEDFQACQALGDLESRREDGAVTVAWAVKADGSVNGVTVGPSTFASRSINACVLDVARQVSFPRSAAPTHVSWTVKFRSAPEGPLADASLR